MVHDHKRCIEQAMRSADAICSRRGVRLTPLRRQVLQLLWTDHRAVKAYDLLDSLKALAPAAKPTTIYRSLEFLLEQGLVHRIESLNAYIGCDHAEQEHDKLFLICDHCHKVEERTAGNVMRALAQEHAAAGFHCAHQTLEIHGMCAACRALRQRSSKPSAAGPPSKSL
jgi:Fur family zinc uptake transcriptional regulator